MDMEPLPQYMRIAMDIASRIATGEIQEHTRISGRSLLSSHYNVSPETVRKAMKLLADMKVVEVQEKKGIYILSTDSARRYVDMVSHRNEQERLRQQLRELIGEYKSLGKRVFSVAEQLVHAQSNPLPLEQNIPQYEIRLSSDSDKIGMNVRQLQFWQTTGATIIAIKRKQNTIISPGPFAELYGGDTIVFVGPAECVASARSFLNGRTATALSSEE